MNNIRNDWDKANKTGNETADTWRLRQQIAGDKAEREAFHAIMKLIAPAVQDEAIRLWVKGTEGASAESYNRRALRDSLSDSEYNQSQDIAHEIWKESIRLVS